MRGVTFLGERKLQLAEFPDPEPGPSDAIVEIIASGMCGSDLKFYRATGSTASLGLGKVSGPVIAGHEPSWLPSAPTSGKPPPASAPGSWCITTAVAALARIA
jgi:NADPH:quinone reductase-like Zn-dependent oxidoreductase